MQDAICTAAVHVTCTRCRESQEKDIELRKSLSIQNGGDARASCTCGFVGRHEDRCTAMDRRRLSRLSRLSRQKQKQMVTLSRWIEMDDTNRKLRLQLEVKCKEIERLFAEVAELRNARQVQQEQVMHLIYTTCDERCSVSIGLATCDLYELVTCNLY